MNNKKSIQETQECLGLPKTFSQARQKAKRTIERHLKERLHGNTDSLFIKYEAAAMALERTFLFVRKYRDQYYEYTQELKHSPTAFGVCSDFIYKGSQLFWAIQLIGEVSDISSSSPVKCFHRVGNSAISAAVKFCSNICSVWENFLGRDLDYNNIKEDFLEQDFHKPEVIDYILEWRSYVHFVIENTLPSEQWPEWKLSQETERVLCLLKNEQAGEIKDSEPLVNTPNLTPLSPNAQIVYDILTNLPAHKALKTPDILDEVYKKTGKIWDEKELYDRVFPQLRPWGLKNKRRVGYWIKK